MFFGFLVSGVLGSIPRRIIQDVYYCPGKLVHASYCYSGCFLFPGKWGPYPDVLFSMLHVFLVSGVLPVLPICWV